MTITTPVRRDDPSCRGVARQRNRREREHAARRRAAEFAARLRDDGASRRQAASCLDLSPHTLRSWKPLRDDARCTPAPAVVLAPTVRPRSDARSPNCCVNSVRTPACRNSVARSPA